MNIQSKRIETRKNFSEISVKRARMEEKQIIKLKLALGKSIQESISSISKEKFSKSFYFVKQDAILSNREKILDFFKENLNLEFDKILEKRDIKSKLKQLSLLKENVNVENDSARILKATKNNEIKIQLEKLNVILKEFENENQKLSAEIEREILVKKDKLKYLTEFNSKVLGIEKVNELLQ
jgi:hypothetical protein